MERTIGAEGVFYVGENFVDLRWQGSDLERNQDAGQRLRHAPGSPVLDCCTAGGFPPWLAK